MANSLEVDIITKQFIVNGSRLPVLDRVKFQVASGEFVAILGPSGCGKTTLIRMILGLDTQYEGEIRVGNNVVSAPGLDRAIVFQEPRLIPWRSVRKNIEFALPDHDDRRSKHVDELITFIGLQEFEEAWPNQLSGGMAQRVALARALVNLPDLLLLDEPFGALDSLTKIAMQAELLRIFEREGTTTLMITHDIDEAIFLADRVIVMSARPSRIRTEIRIPFAHPRERASAEFQTVRRELLEIFHA
jgi:ABC-type nitrate/sulfonate/bicarbonate transport system ATPase subunit